MLEAAEIFLEGDPDKMKFWEKAKDKYLLGVLDNILNKMPVLTRDQLLSKMSDKEICDWLKSSDFDKAAKQKKFKIEVPKIVVRDRIGCRVSDVTQLPFSLKDNSTITGTLNILTDFAKLFELPSSNLLPEYCPIDTSKMKFDIKLTRSHYKLKLSLEHHQNYMLDYEMQLHSEDKAMSDNNEVDDEETDDMAVLNKKQTSLENEQRKFRLQDKPFWDVYNTLYSDLFRNLESGSEESYLQLLLQVRSNKVNKNVDHLGRTLLHIAVEMENLSYVQFLVEAGCHVNAKEGCGLTSLNLAVVKKNKEICMFLVQSGARFDGPLFTSIPHP